MVRLGLVIGLTCLAASSACAEAPKAADASPRSVVPARAESKDRAGPTRYTVGDFVVYRNSGTHLPVPVVLREQVVAAEGNRLSIHVVAQRGDERREWVQVVTDTPENEKNNVVDELYLIEGQDRFRLANEKNRDLYRLYAWTVLTPDGPPTNVKTDRVETKLADVTFTCDRTSGDTQVKGRAVRFESEDCPGFLWTHGTARFHDPSSGEDLLRGEVIAFGHEALCDYERPTCGAGEVCAFVEKDHAACTRYGETDVVVRPPFKPGQRFVCSQGPRSSRGRSHSFRGDVFAADLHNPPGDPTVEIVSPVDGEAFAYDGCEERNDGPDAHNDSRCGLGYGNHVKIWDGKHVYLLGHLSHVKIPKRARVRAGDVIGIEGVSGAAGHRHVHVTVSRPLPGEDMTKLLETPGFKGATPIRVRLAVRPEGGGPSSLFVDELKCADRDAPSYVAP